jgi:hypothetical protein
VEIIAIPKYFNLEKFVESFLNNIRLKSIGSPNMTPSPNKRRTKEIINPVSP